MLIHFWKICGILSIYFFIYFRYIPSHFKFMHVKSRLLLLRLSNNSKHYRIIYHYNYINYGLSGKHWLATLNQSSLFVAKALMWFRMFNNVNWVSNVHVAVLFTCGCSKTIQVRVI